MAAVAQDDMIKEGDSEKFACGLEAMREDAVLGARCGVAGRMVMRGDDGGAVEENGWLEDFARMDDRERETADGNDVDADNGIFRIKAANDELFAVKAGEEGLQGAGCLCGIGNFDRRRGTGSLRHDANTVAGECADGVVESA